MDAIEQESNINVKWGLSHKNNKGYWVNISKKHNLTKNFIREYADYLAWDTLCWNNSIEWDLDFLTEFRDRLNWKAIVRVSKTMTEDILRHFINDLDWGPVSYKKYLSDEFITQYADKINWELLCKYRQLTEEFMEKFIIYIDWNIISTNQKMSPEFIEKHKDKINFIGLKMNYKISYYYRNKWFNYYMKEVIKNE